MVEMTDKGTAGVWASRDPASAGPFSRFLHDVAEVLRVLHRIQYGRPWAGESR